MNDNTLLVSQLLISKLPPRPMQHILHVKPWWELSREAWFQLYLTINHLTGSQEPYLTINHLTGSQEPWVVSSLFIYFVQPLSYKWQAWLVEKDWYAIQQIWLETIRLSSKGCSSNFLKFQKTESKSEFHWTVARRIGDSILKSHLHQLCVYLYHWSILGCRNNSLMGFGVRQIWD